MDVVSSIRDWHFSFLGVLLTVGLLGCLSVPSAAAQPAEPLDRGARVILLTSPQLDTTYLGNAFPMDLKGLRNTPLVNGPVTETPDTTTRVWFRTRADDFRLQLSGTATGMLNKPVPIGDRRSAALTVYKLDRVVRMEMPAPLPEGAGDGAALVLSEIHYGWAMHVVFVGTVDVFTPAVAEALERRIHAGRPIEPLLRQHDLGAVVSSRGLGFGPMTPTPDRIPLSWDALAARYSLADPEPVLAEYTLLQDVQPEPILWGSEQEGSR